VETPTYRDDPQASFEAALTTNERARLVEFEAVRPAHVWDLGQSANKMCCSPLDGELFTLIRGMGLIWVSSFTPPRWFHPTELCTAMGFPTTLHYAELAGTTCVFTREHAIDTTHNAETCQIGNAMHVNSVGSALACLLLLHPSSFGGSSHKEKLSSLSSQSSGVPSTESSGVPSTAIHAHAPQRQPPELLDICVSEVDHFLIECGRVSRSQRRVARRASSID
jgi:hypothetical protein